MKFKLSFKILFFMAVPFLFQRCSTSDDTRLGIKGSFMIAAIGSDGIMVASESRGNIFDRADSIQRPLAYFDLINKTFIINNNSIVNTGTGLIGNVFFESVINAYKKEIRDSLQVSQLLPNFLNYCKKSMPQNIYNQVLANLMISAGFQDDVPTICYFQHNEFGCIQSTGYIESDSTLFANKYLDKLTCKELGEIAEIAINDYALKKKKTETIGGPIKILWLKNKGHEWIKNKPENFKWTYVSEFIKEIKAGNVNLVYTSSENEQKAKLLFQEY